MDDGTFPSVDGVVRCFAVQDGMKCYLGAPGGCQRSPLYEMLLGIDSGMLGIPVQNCGRICI